MSDLQHIQPARLTLPVLRRIARSPGLPVTLVPGWENAVEAAAATVADVIARGDAAYGINTGFGLLARKRIPNDRLLELQTRLVLSHAAGTGAPLPQATVRLILVLKAASLARGHSGVRPVVIESLLALANRGVLPVIPSKGSVGASGDLAPLAHLTAALIGIGEVGSFTELRGGPVVHGPVPDEPRGPPGGAPRGCDGPRGIVPPPRIPPRPLGGPPREKELAPRGPVGIPADGPVGRCEFAGPIGSWLKSTDDRLAKEPAAGSKASCTRTEGVL